MSRDHSFSIEIAAEVGVVAATIYRNLEFWIEKNEANERHFYEGRYWTYNSVAAFTKLFPYLTTKQIRLGLDKLIEAGLIGTGNFNPSAYDRTRWFCLLDHPVLPKGANSAAGEGEPIPDIKPDHKPDDKEPALSEPDLFAGKGEGKEAMKEEGKEEKKQEAPSRLDDAFARFWAAYPAGPRKTDKPKARAAFVAICTGKAKGIPKTDPEVIIAGAQAYARSAPGEYLKMPVGWLHGARWEGAQAPSPLAPPPAQSDVDLAVQFVPELRGLDHNCLPHHLWHKLEHVKMVAKSLRAAGMPLPWSQDAQRPTERPAGGDKAHRRQGSQLGQQPASGDLRGSAHG